MFSLLAEVEFGWPGAIACCACMAVLAITGWRALAPDPGTTMVFKCGHPDELECPNCKAKLVWKTNKSART